MLTEILTAMSVDQLEELLQKVKEELVKRVFQPKEEVKEEIKEEEDEEEDEDEDEDKEDKKVNKLMYMTEGDEKKQQLTIRIVPEYVKELSDKLGIALPLKAEREHPNPLRNFTWTYSEYKNSKQPIACFPYFQMLINTEDARKKLREIFQQTITNKTKSLWYPKRPTIKETNNPDMEDVAGKYQSKYPIYIISKGRWEKRLTADALEAMGVSYHIVVEEQEYENYAKHIAKEKIIVLPATLPFNGSGVPARNYVWEHSIQAGHKYHWILDDNLDGFYRFNRNRKEKVKSGYIFQHIENMVEKHNNVVMAGMNYSMFIPEISVRRPIIKSNTRIYSCILLRNDTKERWRGKYNEDTDLSLRFLKQGYATFLFNNYLCNKQTTLTMKGGNAEIYAGTGVEAKLNSLIEQHPDVVKGTLKKFGRPHHQVNYKPFERNSYST